MVTRHVLGAALLSVAMGAFAPSAAARPTGNSFLADCKAAERLADGVTDKNIIGAMACTSYFAGFRDAAATVGNDTWRTCIPAEVTTTQLVRAYIKWASDEPQYLHEDIIVTVIRAIRHTFPCSA